MSIDKNFVIKNGLEVDAGTLFVDPNTSLVGVGTTSPNYNLEVSGIIGLSSAISIGGTTGITGQALFSTGDGAEWRALPNLRDSILEIASEGQTIFPASTIFEHNPLLLDVFLNGVKLRQISEYASVNSETRVQILVPTFLGDVVELITYSGTSFASGTQGIQGLGGIDGAQGSQGVQGNDGAFAAQGIQGVQGVQGLPGSQGFEGNPGPLGIQGIQGNPGIQGDRGVQGSTGPQGNFGPQGIQGSLGIQGNFGYQGIQGIQGVIGIQGDLGVQGPAGAGAQGIQGIGNTGIQGVQGNDGPQGTQGIQGIGNTGAQGVQGVQGTDGAFAGQGIQGTQGLQGNFGVQGSSGLFAGQGIQGIQGLQGILGPQGDEGIQGVQGILGGNGLQGIQGNNGSQGIQGNLGLKGNQGIQGTQGIVGPQGANASGGNYTLSETGAISRSFDSKLDDFVSILDFGVEEGSSKSESIRTANTSRFISALQTERSVYIPKGTYEFNSEVLVQNKNVTIIGDSERNTILKWTSSTGSNGIDWTTNTAERTLIVRNVKFIAAANKSGSPIYAKDTSTSGGTVKPNVVLENVSAEYEGSLSRWGKGYHFEDCRCGYMNRVTFGGNPTLDCDYGFIFTGTEMGCIDNYLAQCQVSNVHGSPGAAYLVRGTTEGVHISNCMAINCDEGVRSDQHVNASGVLQGEPFVTVQDSHFNVHKNGIYLERVLQSFITGNLIYASNVTVFGETLVNWCGIKFAGSTASIKSYNILITNNIFHGGFPGRESVTDQGIFLRYAEHVQIDNNQFKSCDSPAVKINANASESQVLNNRFQDCTEPTITNSGVNVTVGSGIGDVIGINTSGTSTFKDVRVTGILTANQINTVGGGTPTITSPNNVNINANNVAISTNVSVGGTISVYGAVKLATINPTLVGTSGTTGDIKVIQGAPFYHDGLNWREFYLKEGIPVTQSADTEWSSVIFRNDFNTSLTDQKLSAAPDSINDADLVASPRKYGSKALRLQDANLRYPHRSEYVFDGAWTIEGWFFFDSLPVGTGNNMDILISKTNSLGNNLTDQWYLGASLSTSGLYFYWLNRNNSTHSSGDGTILDAVTASTLTRTWFHLALTRKASDGSIHFFINGTESSYTSSDQIIDNDIIDSPNNDLFLGRDPYYGRAFDGMIDDLRISTNVRYSSNFTPPTEALPITGTLSGPFEPNYYKSIRNISDLVDVSGSPSTGQVLKYNGTTWAPASDLTADGGSGISLTDLSVTSNPAGTNALSYNNSSGTFAFTPTSLVGYATETFVNTAISNVNTYIDSTIVGFLTSGGSASGLTNLTGASAGTYGNNGNSAQIVVDGNGRITGISEVAIIGSSTFDITTTAPGSSFYNLSGTDRNGAVSGNNAGVDVYVGDTINFNLSNVSGSHPFYIRVSSGGSNVSTPGATGQGSTGNSVVSWTPNTAGTYYYQCGNHSGMIGTITVSNAPGNSINVSGISTFNDNVSFGSTILVSGAVNLTTNNATVAGTFGETGDIKMIGSSPFFYDGTAWREFSLTSGTAITTPGDTEWDNVIYRNDFDTSLTDQRLVGAAATSINDATLVTSPVKVGTKALRIQDGGYVQYRHRSEYEFSGEWTIEGWFFFDSLPVGTGNNMDILISKTNSLGNNLTDQWYLGASLSTSGLYFYWLNRNNSTHSSGDGTILDAVTASSYTQTWFHIALVRNPDNGSIHFFINGTESYYTSSDQIIDNDIIDNPNNDLFLGREPYYGRTFDGSIDDLRITKKALYTSNFTPSTTALPISGTVTTETFVPNNKYGEIVLGSSPSWLGTSGVTVSQQSSGNYRLTFTTSYTNSNDYSVTSQGMDQGFASYISVVRSATHIDFAINRQSNDSAVDTGSISVRVINHD